ncbi:hypothetical protein PPYR_02971 [Photinus pyralis]|uniref:Sulfotransferase domain-containing protein n=2 Tax=Photinus pyralis TaxID=7054 RepID=A0A5N4A1K1_PHOPY|nr:WSCD family member AAEL009094 [Photinus pyralis]KAB0791171.1 hypothetical protein PPYR_02971 [Photinus pyralis]
MSKIRLWILGFLLILYLAGVLLLSAVTLHEPKEGGKVFKSTSDHRQVSKSKNYEYGVSSYRSSKRFKIDWCASLQFREPPKPPIALASFPGSGNTWLRYLLQQATGVYTGSVYKDYGLLKSGFPAESISNGSVLVVKTHEWGANARKQFSKAVLLVRAPANAIQAEFNRQSGGHIGFASPDRYKKTRGKYWQQFVTDKLKMWKEMNLDWLYNFTGPTHIIFYEQLVDNVQHTLTVLLNFLEVPISDQLLACALERQEGIYRRKRRYMNFDPYTRKMKKLLQMEQKKVYEAIYNIASPARR